MFLEFNGYSLTAPEPNAVVISKELAAGNLSEDAPSIWFGEYSIMKT